MLNKIKSRMLSILNSAKEKNEILNTQNDNDLEIGITWDDIVNGFPSSETNSVISNSFKRNGFEAKVSACKVILDDGTVYVPQELSDHWEAFIGSPKIKPKKLKYVNITNI